MTPYPGDTRTHWRPWRWPTSPPPPPKSTTSSPLPYCTDICSSASNSVTYIEPACHTEVTVGRGGYPPPVSPWCPRRAGAKSAPSLPSASPPIHYILRLGRALILPLWETQSCMYWDCFPWIPCHPPDLAPISPRRSRFGSAPTVTPSPVPSRTPGRATIT